jgi:uncharacterized membrane protein YqaE (UPF0057 family)
MKFFNMLWKGGRLDSGDVLCLDHYMLKLMLIIIFPPFAVWLDQHEKNYPDTLKIMYCFIFTALLYFPGLFYAISIVKLYD